MTSLLLILKLFAGLILLFLLGRIIGHLLKLDQYYENIHRYKNERIKRHNNEDNQNFSN
jgi:hypothetical protein